MRWLMTGAGGFIAQQLLSRFEQDGLPEGVGRLILTDVADFKLPQLPAKKIVGDIGSAELIGQLDWSEIAGVYHLAATVSSAAERDLDLGLRNNLQATLNILQALRHANARPWFVTASSLAVFGGADLPTVVPETHYLRPDSSYGCQKAITELLACDFGRRGFTRTVVLRFPTIVVRPGKPNAAASSFVSSIIREPLRNEWAFCPVDSTLKLWLASPATAVASLVHSLTLPPQELPCVVNVPGISVSVAEMITALERVAGPSYSSRIRFRRDPEVSAIVEKWPAAVSCQRALQLGFPQDQSMDDIIEQYLATTGISYASY